MGASAKNLICQPLSYNSNPFVTIYKQNHTTFIYIYANQSSKRLIEEVKYEHCSSLIYIFIEETSNFVLHIYIHNSIYIPAHMDTYIYTHELSKKSYNMIVEAHYDNIPVVS